MHPLIRPRRVVLITLLLGSLVQACSAEPPSGCTPVDARFANGYSKIELLKSGHYCLTEDLHARIEFADHPAESVMILIGANDVVLDLQSHTIGRGRLLKNPGGTGIAIDSKYKNIRIMNGALQDFDTAIFYYPNPYEEPIYDAHTNTYRYPMSNVALENITFRNNKKKFEIRIPRDQKP
jgi:hypothetical protein